MNLHSRTSSPAHNEAHLGQLVKAVRDGAEEAAADLHRVFYPGTCFLIRRRLGHTDVDAHARGVLDDVVRRIRADHSIEGHNLPRLVRQLIIKGFPASRDGVTPKGGADRPAVTAAEKILERMSPVERDALRRCYVLGEAPESFLNTLRLTPDQFRAIRLRARNEFGTRTDRTNVA